MEAELVEMDDEEAAMMRDELEIPESGLTTVINGAFSLLNLLTFFTVGDEIGQSWHMTKGGTVYDAAGEIHTDIQQGFVRAEVIGYQELIDAGGYSGARDKGTLRLEGRDYVMQDGDVITVKHTN
jgi:ribosome-binding ATPase YchF (GTP1/OBG family)